MAIRFFFSADAHGATAVWRKWIKAAKAYDVSALMLCGDLTGKVLVPIIKTKNDCFRATYFTREWRLSSENEVRVFEDKLDRIGVYSVRMTSDEFESLKRDHYKQKKLIQKKALERIERWLEILTREVDLRCRSAIVMPGNDDDLAIDEAIKVYEEKGVIYPLDTVIHIDGLEIISLADVNPTPWHTARETEETDLQKKIEDMEKRIENTDKAIYCFHAPPFGTNLDLAPQVDKKLKYVIKKGQINTMHVGSTAVRNMLERHQPLLGLHGHIHESGGIDKIGKTIVINPGSEYSEGILRGYVIEIDKNAVSKYWRVEG